MIGFRRKRNFRNAKLQRHEITKFLIMAKKIILSAIICLLCTTAFAQRRHDHLVPTCGVFDLPGWRFEYHSRVREVLFDGLSDRPIIRFLTMPSFHPERVVEIVEEQHSFPRFPHGVQGRFFIVYHISDRLIWHNREDVKVNKFRTEIDIESVNLIWSLFGVATSQVRFRETIICEELGGFIVIVGFDGTSYYFIYTCPSFGIRSGTVWSPPVGSKMRRLVDIGNRLIDLAKSEQEKVKFDIEFQKEIQQLIDDLKSNSTN